MSFRQFICSYLDVSAVNTVIGLSIPPSQVVILDVDPVDNYRSPLEGWKNRSRLMANL